MSSNAAPSLSKWPFLLGDLVLAGLAVVIMYRGSSPLTPWEAGICLAATISGAWFSIQPFLREYQGALKLAEADNLATAVAQIKQLDQIKVEIVNATGQWQAVQEHSSETVRAAKDVTDRMKAELAEFCAFLQKAHDKEKDHLRLEVEKLHRGERDWLQATVHILDHVFALHAAASRSGQPAVLAQVTQFQMACREVVRRLGLVGFAPVADEAVDPNSHQLETGEIAPDSTLRVIDVVAPGYTYQGALVRKALVRAQPVASETSPLPNA